MAYCTYCGQQLSDSATSCAQCGHPVPGAGAQATTYRRTENLAVASLVLGIAGFVMCPLVCSVIAVVLGYQARRRLDEDPTLDGAGMAKAGVILGWVGIAFGVVLVVALIGGVLAGINGGPAGSFDAIGGMH